MDELSNTLVVSAAENLLENVALMIEALDEAAKPTTSTVRVLKVGVPVDGGALREKIDKLFGKPAPVAIPGQNNPDGQQQQQLLQKQAPQRATPSATQPAAGTSGN